jgi:methylmalonyl-CoA mutase
MTEAVQEELSLAAEFPPASRADWLALVAAAIKGAPFEQVLVGRTYDSLRIEPLYDGARDAQPIAARLPGAPWQVLARVDHPDPAMANGEARHELANGATGLSLVFAGSVGSYGYGFDTAETTIARILEGIDLAAGISIELDLGSQSQDVPRRLVALTRAKGVAPAATGIRFAVDPLGAHCVCGALPAPLGEIAPRIAAIICDLANQGFTGPFAVADARVVHAAGGSEAQELAFALASATALLRVLEGNGVELEAARRMIFFRLAADADQILTIAKFRALRRLWARVEEACGVSPVPAFVSAETAWRMMTRRDPWVNMLRATMAAFSAGLGGADAITVLPFTVALGLADRFARRIARNTQLILIEEAHLAKVADPAAGSGAIEGITTELCRAAWMFFQEIEAAGGIFAALQQGLIQANVGRVRAARLAAVARRTDPLTGTSEFAHLAEVPVSVLEVAPIVSAPIDRASATFEPLPCLRLAEAYERLRDRSDRILAATGARPKVFLANLGPVAAFSARADFAANLFAGGGIEAVTNDGFAGRDAMVEAYSASGAKLACLCSSDEIYAAEAPLSARALLAAGARHIYLSGKPDAHEAILRSGGVGTFIHRGCDAVAILEAAYGLIS